jgi:hypothetical protein
MSTPQQPSVRNQLLAAVLAEDFAALQSHLEPVELELRQVLIEPNRPIALVYFPEHGYTSITANTNSSKIEIGLIGREGMVGVSIALGVRASPFEFFVQHAREGLRLASYHLEEVIDEPPSLGSGRGATEGNRPVAIACATKLGI